MSVLRKCPSVNALTLVISSITRLPQSLAAMGASLMEQTGWNITILAGGPSPEHDGMIMSFL